MELLLDSLSLSLQSAWPPLAPRCPPPFSPFPPPHPNSIPLRTSTPPPNLKRPFPRPLLPGRHAVPRLLLRLLRLCLWRRGVALPALQGTGRLVRAPADGGRDRGLQGAPEGRRVGWVGWVGRLHEACKTVQAERAARAIVSAKRLGGGVGRHACLTNRIDRFCVARSISRRNARAQSTLAAVFAASLVSVADRIFKQARRRAAPLICRERRPAQPFLHAKRMRVSAQTSPLHPPSPYLHRSKHLLANLITSPPTITATAFRDSTLTVPFRDQRRPSAQLLSLSPKSVNPV
eukprot:4688210-Pleurochrysis_carterae.AAC.1